MTDIVDDVDAESVDESVVQLREDISELLASLSNETDTPSEFEQASAPFVSADVNFESADWMAHLVAVQGWLRFEIQLSAVDPGSFATSLADALGFEDLGSAFVVTDDNQYLSIVALDRLRERAEKAVALQRLFADEFLRDGGTRESASRLWVSGWEDEDEAEEAASADPVSAKADTQRITDFVAQAQGGKLNLTPSYQRGDVWGTGARQLLIESVLRGIPLPSIILLKPSDGQSQLYEVVDGKQRLTSILRFVGKHPLALEHVREADRKNPEADLLSLFNSDYPKFKKAWKNLYNQPLTSTLEEQYYFPFKLRVDERGLPGEQLAPLRGKYYTQIKGHSIRVADQTALVEEVFEGYSEYKVPVIIYSRATTRQIHEVFNLYNRQGTHLNAEEIRNAIFHELQITRATLVAAGDSDARTPIAEIAPALEPVWPSVLPLQETLRGYSFGESRYRRTKVLSWILSTLLVESHADRLPSTAKHIDSLFQRVQADKQDPLRSDSRIRAVFEWIAEAAEAHAAFAEAWAPQFKDGESGSKWQELQLVGSFVGIAIAAAAATEDLDTRLAAAAPKLFEASKGWKRPTKTQTRTQWQFISSVAQGVVSNLGVDPAVASNAMKQRFGSSGIESLWAVSNYDVAE